MLEVNNNSVIGNDNKIMEIDKIFVKSKKSSKSKFL